MRRIVAIGLFLIALSAVVWTTCGVVTGRMEQRADLDCWEMTDAGWKRVKCK